jgi:tRNA (cytidine32/uridine32-2'-O)-methyltransferase
MGTADGIMNPSSEDLPSSAEPAADRGSGRIRFVLVETSLSGNIGAVARAMKNMGLSRMELVRPHRFPDADAVARASGADDLLANAGVHDDLAAALAGCRLVVGSSARLRSLSWPQLDPHQCAALLLDEAQAGDVALVLGRESSGLTNDELGACHYLAHIPSVAGFSSLNIAAAAQVFAYEIRRSALARGLSSVQHSDALGSEIARRRPGAQLRDDLAAADEMEGFYAHLASTLTAIGFADPEQSSTLLRRLRRLFNRARPDRTELNILRGILSAAQGNKRSDRFAR